MQAALLWKEVFSKEHLREHYIEKVKKKPSIGMDKITPEKFGEELDENLDIIVRKVNNGTYHFTRYKQLLFTKGPSKAPRCVCVPTIRDKLTASALNELLDKVYEQKCRTPLPHTVINDIVLNIKKYDYFIKLDIKSYYATICQDKLIKILRYRIRKAEILSLIENAIKTEALEYPVRSKRPKKKHDKGIPEGLPISNSLANIYMINIDKKYSNINGIAYYRYVDDILVLADKENFEKVVDDIKTDIRKLGLEINDNKIDEGLVKTGFEYLGYKISPQLVTVRQSSIFKIEQSIEDLLRESRKNNIKYIEWKLNLKITGFIHENRKYGWLPFYLQITDMPLLFHLDELVMKLVSRYGLNGKVKVKRFVRAYMEFQKALHVTKYIPNIDKFTLDKKKEILTNIYDKDLSDKSEEYIENLFGNIMRKEIIDIEMDVQNIS